MAAFFKSSGGSERGKSPLPREKPIESLQHVKNPESYEANIFLSVLHCFISLASYMHTPMRTNKTLSGRATNILLTITTIWYYLLHVTVRDCLFVEDTRIHGFINYML